ncbi:MAG: DegT/DnrJ/EryC1/StrS family aminotransferase [Rhodospirillaceae bacterium]|jgi:UDP-2-acetamido-2-deoxy-ribo-hexuluronate aminotransferase|nr:DegT/DnrJ/EryC1/StrS family aminotransferase [Rhodospirillaceae bacterium]MBT5416001.1 DegT/DnrJ/EryC1/StrS family aminotransferase [Rhodospirillaceae bacterium]MBT6118965.1 DegT/DnrJ/EryC1/StrS family aminotransferase [Rhodospirillaceae bacterium]
MSDSPALLPFIDLKAQYAKLKPAIDARIAAVLDHGQYILGPEVAELEAALASFAGGGQAIAVASGTDALLIALMAEEIGRGDAVFVPSFTFPATAEVICLLGAVPVFVDVEPATCNIDPASLTAAIEAVETAGRLRPRAVIAVDLYGLPANYRAIAPIAERHGLFLLADAAQSFGGADGGRRVGTLAPATALSFFPAKPLGCYGDGGALLTDDAERAARWRSIRAHGKGDGKYDIVRIGVNGRLDTLQAAILLAKLEVLEAELDARERVAGSYDQALGDLVDRPARPADGQHAWAQYTIRTSIRDAVAARLRERGVPTAIYYPRPLHRQPAYADICETPVPLEASEALAHQVLSLPMHPYLDMGESARIGAEVLAALEAGA